MTRLEYFEKAKEHKSKLETKVNETEAVLKSFDKFGKSDMGLTPDHVKNIPEYRAAKFAFTNAFNDLRNFNSNYVKTFKAEIKAEKKLNKVQCGTCHGTNPMLCTPDCF